MTRSSPHDERVSIRDDNRAVSEVIGFILLFGLLIAGASIIQTYGIPAQNERVEFDHNLRVQEDIVRLSDGVETAGLTGASVSSTVEAGTDYPNRLFFFNPSPPSGALRTGDVLSVDIANARATGEAGDYWNGSVKTFDTRAISYSPNYNVYRSAPTTVVEYGVVYNDNPSGQTTFLKRGSFIRGNRISLVTVDGTFNRGTAQSITVDAVPISAPSNTISLSPTQPLNLTVESTLSVANWNDVLADEMTTATPGGNVQSITPGPTTGTVTISLQPNVSYQLRLARVGLESGYNESTATPSYLTVGDTAQTVAEDSTETVTVQVRDQFNNPVSSVDVSAATRRADSSVTPLTDTTDADGQITFTYTAPEVSGASQRTDRLNLSFDGNADLGSGFDPTTPENATVTFTIINSDSSGVTVQSEAGAGGGGQSEWSDSDNSNKFTVANGRWNNITHVERITLSDGEMVTVERCKTGTSRGGQGGGAVQVFTECKFIDTLRISFSLSGTDGATSQEYTADVNLEDCDQDRDFTDSCSVGSLTFRDRANVTVFDNSGARIFERSLRNGEVQALLSGSGTDILDANSYTSASQTTLDRLKLDDATWLTSAMQGRVTVTITSS